MQGDSPSTALNGGISLFRFTNATLAFAPRTLSGDILPAERPTDADMPVSSFKDIARLDSLK